MDSLTGKVAIVTGASSGIGRAAAKLYASNGAKLVVAARRQHELSTLVEEISNAGGEAIALAGDVCSEDYAKALVDLALKEYGKLDVAFNNAGMLGEMIPAVQKSRQDWQKELDTNLTSAFLGAKYQLPELEKTSGSLIFTSSFVGYTVGMPNMSAYAVSKAGLIGLMKSLAVEYGAQGVRVNALLPGGTKTRMAEVFGDAPEVIDFVNGLHALKRQAEPEEIAQGALYLASAASSFVTGTAMLVDGGVSISKT